MATAKKDISIGYELPPITRVLTQEKLNDFEGQLGLRVPWERFKNPIDIHTDEEMAKKAGFPTTIGHGHHLAAWISEMMTEFLGEGWIRGGKITVNFIRLFLKDDTITARAVLREKTPENGKTRLVFEVWCENQRGEKVAVGTASGLV